MTITIRPVDTVEGAEHFQILEQMIWDSPPEDTVPLHVTMTVVRNGGGLLGAFDEEGPAATGGMVGMAFWFPGLGTPTTSGEGARIDAATRLSPPVTHLKMCSHMAGVHPAWQGKGIGLLLKLAQRQAILEQGLTDWVTWTYDPLLRTNAVFNIRRLGAVCNTYRRDWYGVMRDALNAGTPSDRCQVDWWLKSERVAERAEKGQGRRTETPSLKVPDPLILPAEVTGRGLQAPLDVELALDGTPLAVPIPDDIGAIRRSDAGLGMAWRLYMRHTLEAAFVAGYMLTDCLVLADLGWHYLLESPAGDGPASRSSTSPAFGRLRGSPVDANPTYETRTN